MKVKGIYVEEHSMLFTTPFPSIFSEILKGGRRGRERVGVKLRSITYFSHSLLLTFPLSYHFMLSADYFAIEISLPINNLS